MLGVSDELYDKISPFLDRLSMVWDVEDFAKEHSDVLDEEEISPAVVAKWIINDVQEILNEWMMPAKELPKYLDSWQLLALISLEKKGYVNHNGAKDILRAMMYKQPVYDLMQKY